MNSVSAVRRAMLAVVLVALPFNVATAASPILWTLKTPAGTDALSGWRLPAPPPTAGGLQPILPDPTGGVVVDDAAPLPQDFSIAPSVDNILNRRRDLSEDQMGLDGSSDTYLRSVGRTFGLAIKKALY